MKASRRGNRETFWRKWQSVSELSTTSRKNDESKGSN